MVKNRMFFASNITQVSAGGADAIYICDNDGFIRKINPDGTQSTDDGWPFQITTGVSISLSIDPLNSFIYASVADSPTFNVARVNFDGSENTADSWPFTSPANPVNDLQVDGSGFVYAMENDENAYKINSNGTQNWSYNFPSSPQGRFVMPSLVDDFTYVSASDAILRRLDIDGVEDTADNWPISLVGLSGSSYPILTDNSNFIYVGDDRRVRKFNPNGSENTADNWPTAQFSPGNRIDRLLLGPNDFIFALVNGDSIRKINPDGSEYTSESWPFTGITGSTECMALDSSGFLYARDGLIIRKINPDGSENTDGNWPLTLTAAARDVVTSDGRYPIFWS